MALAIDFDPKNTSPPSKNSGKDKGKMKAPVSRKMEVKELQLKTLINTNKAGGQQGNALGSYCSIQLNHENYLLWKNMILPVIREN